MDNCHCHLIFAFYSTCSFLIDWCHGNFLKCLDVLLFQNIGAMNPNQMQPTPSNANGDPAKQQGMNIESMMNIASLFMGPQSGDGNGGLMNLLPVALQALTSFNGPEGDKASGQQKDFLSFFSPYLEQIYAFWDQFVNSEHGQAVLKATGADAVIKVSVYHIIWCEFSNGNSVLFPLKKINNFWYD